ncbi:MAG TPA: hypothetical protein PLV32_02230 [Chitinophagaceae bacterium]|nr:hypothetical protein [Chitinophagaceae bacterium]
MKSYIPVLAVTLAVFSSCSTAYKAGQTPDDVYYSPTQPREEYVNMEKRDDRYYRGNDQDYYEDRFLRMRLNNRYRWSALDDYYFYNTYAYNAYGRYNNWYSPWNSYWAWNSFYNPYNPYCGGLPYYHYGGGSIIKNPIASTPPSRASVFNPNSYLNNSNTRTTSSRSIFNTNNNNNSRYNNYNNTNNRNRNAGSLGESMRKVFSGSGNNNNSYSTPSRSYEPSSNSNRSSSSSSSSGSRSSGGSSGGSKRPPR